MSIDAMKKVEPVCKCNLRTRLVGDGCEVCNPEYAADHAAIEAAEKPVAEVTCFGHDANIHPMITYNARLMCNFEAGNYHLYTTPQPAIPAGYALVPVEPTPEMLEAWARCDGYLSGYKAMLAAAPKPENGK